MHYLLSLLPEVVVLVHKISATDSDYSEEQTDQLTEAVKVLVLSHTVLDPEPKVLLHLLLVNL